MVNENKSSCYPEPESYKQGVCSPYNELPLITWNKDKLKTSWLLYIFRYFKFIEFCEIIINGKMYEPIFRKFFQNIILT